MSPRRSTTTLQLPLLLLLLSPLPLPSTAQLQLQPQPNLSLLHPSCCDASLPAQSAGKVQQLLTTGQANITGSTPFLPPANFPLSLLKNSSSSTTTQEQQLWRWNFAAVQLNSTLANGDNHGLSTQFAAATWLDAPGLWDSLSSTNTTNSSSSTWADTYELCALHLTFLTPPQSDETQRLGYTRRIPSSLGPHLAPTPYGGCEHIFDRAPCAEELTAQIRALYTRGGCPALARVVLDSTCAPNAGGLLARPVLLGPGSGGEGEFQGEWFVPSAGRGEGVILGKGGEVDRVNLVRVWGSVVNEVRPLVLVGRVKGGGLEGDVEVAMACVKGVETREGSLRVVSGEEGWSGVGKLGRGKAMAGLVVAVAGCLVLGMV